MGKKGIGLLASVVAMIFVASSMPAVALAGVGPETIVLKAKMGNVTFQHYKHQEKVKCGECHHEKGPDGKQVPYHKGMKIKKCADCHNKSFSNKKLSKVKNAFHQNCKSCHKKQHSGPTKCKGCHKK